MNIREVMRSGKLYTDESEGLPKERLRCRELLYEYNNSHPAEEEKRTKVLKELLGSVGEHAYMEPPIRFAYGINTHIGDWFYANFNFVVVDDIEVYIGDYVMMAPNVSISVTGHPVHPELRANGDQFSKVVTIKDHVWIGMGTMILPGVTIGENSVIGAGSVVTKDIPANVVAMGTPCRVVRPITEADKNQIFSVG